MPGSTLALHYYSLPGKKPTNSTLPRSGGRFQDAEVNPFCLASIQTRSRAILFLLLVSAAGWLPFHASAATNSFEKDILAFEASDRTNPPAPGGILFAGDSQFTLWKKVHEDLPEYRIINRGFGGSKITDLLYYTDRIVIPYHPRMIVVNEGGNDIHAGRTPEQVLADMKTFVNRVRAAMPTVPIAFFGLASSPARWTETDSRRRFNQLLREYLASGKDLLYLDIFDSFMGPDGKPREELFIADKLHNSAAGYAIRVKFLRPILGTPDYPDRKPRN